MIVQRFLEEGYYERHLNKTRAMYRSRHDALIEELKGISDICSISGEHAGVHLLLTFHGERTEEELIERAREQEIRVYGMSEYCIQKTEEKPTILLGYANLSEEQIRAAARILVTCWK